MSNHHEKIDAFNKWDDAQKEFVMRMRAIINATASITSDEMKGKAQELDALFAAYKKAWDLD